MMLIITLWKRLRVSIPMTVLGGLQSVVQRARHRPGNRFNTDDGIRRAAIAAKPKSSRPRRNVSIPMTVLGGLQYPNHRVRH